MTIPSKSMPDFFVVGAPRCGTTAICRYLAFNPQICFSRPKEPHFFTRLDHEPTNEEIRRDYMEKNFSHFEPEHRALGEGSVSYLYLPGVIERINRLNPEAKFVVQVRNPLEMLRSYHLRMLFLLQEDEKDLAKAWELEASRMQGENIPKRCLHEALLFYSQVARFGVQVERLFNVVGRDRAHIIVFDDFKADTLATYKNLLEFLQVDYDGQTEFERRFESVMYRYHWLQKLLFVPATKGGKAVETLQRRSRKYNPDGTKRLSLIKRATRLNKVPTKAAPLTLEMKNTISKTLMPDVEHLSRLLDRDLTHWFA